MTTSVGVIFKKDGSVVVFARGTKGQALYRFAAGDKNIAGVNSAAAGLLLACTLAGSKKLTKFDDAVPNR